MLSTVYYSYLCTSFLVLVEGKFLEDENYVLRIFMYFFFLNFIYLFLAALGLHCCTWAFSSWGEQGLLFVAVRGLLMVASLVAEHRL